MSVTFSAYNPTTEQFADVESINVNNSNAGRILRAVGFDDEVSQGLLAGETEAKDLQARVVLAKRHAADDYMKIRLGELWRLACTARAQGCIVTWT